MDIKDLIRDITPVILEQGKEYIEPMKRLVWDELVELAKLLDLGKAKEALAIVEEKMNLEELTRQKVKLADLTEELADENAEKKSMIQELLLATLKIAFSILVAL